MSSQKKYTEKAFRPSTRKVSRLCREQCFRKLFLCLLYILTVAEVQGQNSLGIQNYAFATGVDQTKWYTLTAANTIVSTYADDIAYGLYNIGFPFNFCGTNYTQFSVNSNGCLKLGSPSCSYTSYSSPFSSSNAGSSSPKIIGIGRDLSTGSNGSIRYQTFGTAPNRILVCEFQMAHSYSSSYTADSKWQVQLHESNRQVVLVYNSTPTTTPSTFQIGIANNATDVVTINPASHTTSNGSTSSTYSQWPGQWCYYTFTPLSTDCGIVTHLNVDNIGTNSAFVSWTLTNSTPSTQVTLQYDDNPAFSSPQSVTTDAESPFALTGLESNTVYYVRAYLNCDEGTTDNYAETNFTTEELPCANTVQHTVTIGGTTTSNNYLGGYSYYGNTFSEQIYRQSEIGSATTLTGMAVYATSVRSSRQISIYLGHTNQNSVNNWIAPDDLTEVWSGTTQYTSNSWNNITFTTPFEYNGSSNLLLIISDHTGTWLSAPYNSLASHENGSYYSQYTYRDGTAYSTTSLPTASGNLTTQRTSVRWFSDQCNNYINCEIPALHIYNITDQSASLQWTPTNSSLYRIYIAPIDQSPVLVATTTETSYNLTGLESLTHYQVRIVTDCGTSSNLYASDKFRTKATIRSSSTITSIDIPTDLCSGTTLQISIGQDTSNEVVTYSPQITLGHSERTFLPDGIECNGLCSYNSPVTFESFPEGATITSVDNIDYVRINMEHSYIGDIYIGITCPTGQTVSLMNQSGSGSSSCSNTIPAEYHSWSIGSNASQGNYLGNARDSENNSYKCDSTASGNEPGLGWNYCWSESSSPEFSYAPGDGLIYRAANAHNGRIDSSDVENKTNFYHPNQSFNNLIGCPLNGTWNIEVIDGFSIDNGYIFSWDLTLNHELMMTCPIVEKHLIGPYVSTINDSTFSIQVPADLNHDTTISYHILLITSCGTQIDTTVSIRLHANKTIVDEQNVCDSIVWNGHTYRQSGNAVATHRLTSTAGCDSTIVLNLTINTSYNDTTTVTACDSYDWNGITYSQSTQQTVIHPRFSGCDSVFFLNLTIRHSSSGIDEQDVCDFLNWHGVTYTASTNTPTHHSTNAAGCDSTTTLHLTIRHSSSGIEEHNVCDSLNWHGITYTASTNTPTHHSTNAAGCDSTTTLHLTIRHSSSGIDEHNVCDSLNWHRVTYTTSTNTPTHHSTNAAGCDSTTTLHLTIRHSSSGIDEQDVCDSLNWHGITYTASTNTPTHHSTNAAGCDSTTTLHLTIRHSSSGIEEHNVCGSLNWHGVTYTASTNTPTHHSTNAAGCDSTTTLHLTIRHSSSGIDTKTTCDSISWHGVTYTASTNTPTHHSTNAAGCDSTTTLHLTVYHSRHDSNYTTACESYTWKDSNHTISGSYRHDYIDSNNCFSSETLILHIVHGTYQTIETTTCNNYAWHGTTLYESGKYHYDYTNTDGCPSTDTLQLTVLESTYTDTSIVACGHYHWDYNNSTYTESGTYLHNYLNGVNCPSVDTLHLTIHSTYETHLFDTICNGENAHLAGEIYSADGDYSHLFQSRYDCDSTVWLHLIVRQRLNVRIRATHECTTEIWELNADGEGEQYTWNANPDLQQLNGHEHSNNIRIHIEDTTLITLTADYASGRSCPNSTQRTLEPIVHVFAQIECRPEILTSEQLEITAQDISTGHTARQWYINDVAWGDAAIITCPIDERASEIIFQLIANNNLCSDTAKRILYSTNETLFVPNVFTPSLSTNSTFRSYGTGILEFEIAIYNREGLLMFHSNDITTQWDGTHDSEPCPQGSYVYLIRYRGRSIPDGWQTKTGAILLLR